MIATLLTQIGWSAVCFALGYLTCQVVREVHQIKEAVVTPEPTTQAPAPRRAAPARRFGWDQAVGLVIVVLAVVSMAVIANSISNRLSETECRNKVSDQRAEVAGRDREALDQLLVRIFGPHTTEAKARVAYRKYAEAIQSNDEARAGLSYTDHC